MKSFFKKYLTGLSKNSHQKGAALIVTLLVMLVLVLLGLSLVMQSNTEHLIAKNEQDAFQALANGEAVLELSNQIIREWVKNQTPIPTNLTPVLTGDVDGGGTDEILGFRSFNAGLTNYQSDLNDANEETTSVLYNDGTHNWEVFRIGVDTNGDDDFDAGTPRTLIFARVEDNYDTAQDMIDTDLRIRMVIDAEYPVFLNDDGTENTSNISVRPRAKRRLYGRFWPGGLFAIRTQGDLALWGGDAANPLQLCGECGSAHANGTIRAGKVSEQQINVCGEVTGTGDFEYNGGTIVGDQGLAPEVFIPVINPYYPIYVPDQSYFAQSVTLRDATPGPQYDLSCPAPSATDPGSSKYFALVRNTTGPNRMAQVWKAYPDTTDTKKWYWRLIDEKYAPGNPGAGAQIGEDLNAQLDNCGRVVSCNALIGCTPDRIETAGVWTSLPAGSAVTDAGNSEFYGWGPAGNYGTATCTGDNISSSGIGAAPDLNDNYKNDFNYVTGTSPLTISGTGVSTRSCGVGVTCPAIPPLPGTGIAEASPGNSDFKTATVLTDAGWGMSGGNIYSPMYGAVLFVYGDVDLSGNLSDIVFNNGVCGATGCAAGAQQDISNAEAVPTNTWKVTVISYGHADVGGGVRYSPAFGTNANYQYAVVAGRDLRLHGSNNNFDCNGADCDGAPTGTAADYSGIFVLHGQLDFAGNVGVNGFVIAEDRIDCDNFVTPTGGNLANEAHGSLQIHYDCVNPADPWASRGVKLREWEEVQR